MIFQLPLSKQWHVFEWYPSYVHVESLYAHKTFNGLAIIYVANDILDFTKIVVSTLQLYNHTRKWEKR
jgi:hypothetical protein